MGGPLIISAREESLLSGNRTGLSPGRYVCLSIIDMGEGMSADTLTRATEPFFTTKGVGKGTGLGLSMVQGFAEQSGGRLALKSEKGSGTTVEIWLPVAATTQESVTPENLLSPMGQKPVNGRPLVVLAVDDDALVLMNTAAMLEDLGHSVREASSATEALKILGQGTKFDLVVTDQAMPRMTGVQLAEAIKADWLNLPIILATGYAELPAGLGSELPKLSKPFTQQELANAVSAATAGR